MASSWTSCRWSTILELRGRDLWISMSSSGPSYFQHHIPQDSSKQIPEMAKVCSPEIQACDLPFCFVPSSQDPKLHHLMVTAAKAAPDTNIINRFSFVHIRTSREPPLTSSLISWARTLSSIPSRKLLDCLYPDVLSHQQILRRLKPHHEE